MCVHTHTLSYTYVSTNISIHTHTQIIHISINIFKYKKTDQSKQPPQTMVSEINFEYKFFSTFLKKSAIVGSDLRFHSQKTFHPQVPLLRLPWQYPLLFTTTCVLTIFWQWLSICREPVPPLLRAPWLLRTGTHREAGLPQWCSLHAPVLFSHESNSWWVLYVEFCPQNSYVEFLTLRTSESNLIWKQNHWKIISQDEVILEQGECLNQHEQHPYKKRQFGQRRAEMKVMGL